MIRTTRGTVLTILLVMIFGVSSVFATTLTEVNNKILETQEKLEQGKEDEANLTEEISQVEERIETTQQEIDVLAGDIAAGQVEIDQKTEELEEKEDSVDESIEGLNRRLRNMYKSGSVGFLDILLSSQDVSEFISNLDLVQEIYTSDKEVVVNLEREYKELEEDREELTALNEALEIQKAELDEKERSLEADKATLETEKTETASNNAHLQEDLESLNAQAAEIQAIINSQTEYQGEPSGGGNNNGGGNTGGGDTGGNTGGGDTGGGNTGGGNNGGGNNGGGNTGGGTLGWPVQGYYNISSGYGWRTSPFPPYQQSKHTGIDIPGPVGTPILAAEAGKVIAAYYNVSYGNMVIISHGGGLWTVYAHNSSLYVVPGQIVSRGQSIAGMGSTGDSTGSHCHFEVRTSQFWGSDVDPMGYL